MKRRFKEARLQKQMKVIEVAKLLEVAQSTVSAWETERKEPSIDTIARLAELYGVSIEYLLGYDSFAMLSKTEKIPTESIRLFHGKPVWVYGKGWSLVNAERGEVVYADGCVDRIADNVELYLFGTVSPCEKRVLLIPKIIYDFIDLPTAVRREGDHYILTRNGERIKSLRSERLLWLKALSVYGYTGSVTPEILRATFIRHCFEKGINFETVSYFTGLTVLVLRTKYGHFAKVNLDIPNFIYETPIPVAATGKQMNLLILGAGSHGHAVYEIADRLGIFQKISFLDDNITGDGIVGRIEDVLDYRKEFPLCFVAIGNNERRKELAEKVTKAGFITPRLISPETSVARGAVIGQGTIVMPQATINAGAKIGDFCIIASNSLIGFNATVESYAHCDCASVVMKDCIVSTLMTVESGEIVKQSIH